jgi:predicted nucleic-acid-binding Zn-ribbon protein
MAKKKAIYCRECGKTTVHRKISAEMQGVERAFFALCTAGFSEILMEHDWQCEKCGEITRE